MWFSDIFKIGKFKTEIEQLKTENQVLHSDNSFYAGKASRDRWL